MTVPVLPLPPSRADSVNFVPRGDAWNAAMYTFSAECNLFGTQLEAARDAALAGMGAGVWTSGTYAIGTLKSSPSTGYLYRRLIATASATEPAVDTANWALQTLPAWPLTVVAGATQTGVKNMRYEMRNTAASTFTLPAAPVAGDSLRVGFTNGRTDNVIARNGQPIMGLAEDCTVDIPYFARVLVYVDATFGWRIEK